MSVSYSWSVDPRNFVRTVRSNIAKKTEELTEAIFDGVVERSPVLTGSFRGSWTASLNVPNPNIVVGGAPGNPIGPPVYPRLRVNRDNPEKTYVSNNTPYGAKIEQGSSSQAPNGVVALTLQSLRR